MTFTENQIPLLCNKLAKKEKVFAAIIKQYGYPPFYHRSPTFATLIHIILEQQVSLASAKAAFIKLKEKIKIITPQNLLQLSDLELKECYFSRQKIIYTKIVAQAILNKQINLKSFSTKNNETVKSELVALKGIGNWTAEVYLMMALQRVDFFPIGDIALINSVKHVFQLPQQTTKETILEMSKNWQPYRTIASFMLWNAYIQRNKHKNYRANL